MTYHGWQEVIGVVGIFGLVLAVVTIVIWHLSATWRARAVLARDYEYRTLAERSVRIQESTERQLVEINSRLGDLNNRMESVERILKQVE
ncbi:hypothetical protein ACFU7T_01895 [Streptomyces sp. NPDC057555]|uniref:hypothetical protein n=1 Tax=Streptomyces sp. NPDC057555 TaxID=3346166 RepID=UPI0036C5B49B